MSRHVTNRPRSFPSGIGVRTTSTQNSDPFSRRWTHSKRLPPAAYARLMTSRAFIADTRPSGCWTGDRSTGDRPTTCSRVAPSNRERGLVAVHDDVVQQQEAGLGGLGEQRPERPVVLPRLRKAIVGRQVLVSHGAIGARRGPAHTLSHRLETGKPAEILVTESQVEAEARVAAVWPKKSSGEPARRSPRAVARQCCPIASEYSISSQPPVASGRIAPSKARLLSGPIV